MQADLFDGVRHDPKAAPAGYFAALKADARPTDGSNICRACDWRPECQKTETDFTQTRHRCMPWARDDGCSVLFKRLDHLRDATKLTPNDSNERPEFSGPLD